MRTHQPPRPFDFAFNVNDDPTYNQQSRQESSDGKVVKGSYRVALPDGRTQIVSYTADDYGYNSEVTYEGEAKYPEEYEPAYKAAHPKAAYPAPAYPKAAYPAPAYPKAAYPEPAYPKAAYPEPAYPKAAYPEPAYPKAAYPEPSYPKAA